MSIIKNTKYEIIKKLGKGGFGRVLQVKNKSDNKYYALKEIIIKAKIKDKIKDELENIKKEADILSKFNSKNIVKYYDSYLDKNKFYILMEYCNGKNLKNYLDEFKKNDILIEENILYEIIKQLCIGIKEIHNKNVIHRDLKPENIFMNENKDIKIGDFGISKLFNRNKKFSETENRAGSTDYMAPEIIIKGIYNEKSDMYSLGCIIYELFNLRKYFNDILMKDIKTIDTNMYNNRWQEIIDSLLNQDYNQRMNIDQVYDIILNEININKLENKINNINTINQINYENIIVGEIYINNDNINKDIRIINSYENCKREWNKEDSKDDYQFENEKEIKENIEIKMNEKIIEFKYYYKFKEEGKYIIEYTFKNNLTKNNHMFCDCNLLTNLNLSNFKTQNVTNMSCMFLGCKSLTDLDLSSFNTQNVTNMSKMFDGCESLTNLNLSNFKTQNTTNMSDMFLSCRSLTNLNLSNFETQNVANMSGMFWGCKSLTNLNLSNFNTQNVTNMNWMFDECNSLTNLNLSNFNTEKVTNTSGMFSGCNSLINLNLSDFKTQKVIDMSGMFDGCESLTNLNLSNFNTQNVTNMNDIFFRCYSLTKNNIITKDNKILDEL